VETLSFREGAYLSILLMLLGIRKHSLTWQVSEHSLTLPVGNVNVNVRRVVRSNVNDNVAGLVPREMAWEMLLTLTLTCA
jgi:hypothetical protein